jgi:hypothetical protein
MSGIDVVTDPHFIARFACGNSQASFSPEDSLEAVYAELPNSIIEAATGSIIEPISWGKVSSLALPKYSAPKPVVAPDKREKIRLDLALCELSWLWASIGTLLNQCLIVESIHSVPVAQLALVSRSRNALNAKHRDAQTAIQRRSRSNDGLHSHVWMQSRLCGNSETLRMTFP